MRVVHLESASIADYIGIIEAKPGAYRNFFRGQQNAMWPLTPALYRLRETYVAAGSREAEYNIFEEQAIERFFNEGLPYLPPIPRSYSNDRILAQHFGVPTRLLDWSRDPLVALFFAVQESEDVSDGAVFCVAPSAAYRPEDVHANGQHQVVELVPPAIDRRIPAQKSVFTHQPYGPANEPYVPLDQRADVGAEYISGSDRQRGFYKVIIDGKQKRVN